MLTAKDLLYKSLDYDGFWNSSKKMLQSQPSLCRKAQLDILLKAFGIQKKNAKALSQLPYSAAEGKEVFSVYAGSGRYKAMKRMQYIKTLTDFKYFSTGEFLADLDEKVYLDLQGEIAAAAKAIFPAQAATIAGQPVNLTHLFSILYNFRLSVHLMFMHSFGRKMHGQFSLEEDYGLHLRTKFVQSMNGNLSEIDETLCILIDQEQKSFTELELDFPFL